jgi:hypothetical protein
MRRLVLLLVVTLIAAGCAEHESARLVERKVLPLPREASSPNATCPVGWMRISQQAWVQADGDGDGRVDFPQSLPDGGGGHLHEEFCAPVGLDHGSTLTFHVDLMAHQGFDGTGDGVDVGLSPDGHSLGRSDAPSMGCGPKPAKCHDHVTVTASGIPGGEQSLRLRYLPATLPSGERWFVGGQTPIGGLGSEWGGLCGKSWLGDYAVACFSDLSLFGKPLSGTVTVPVRSKGDHINSVFVHTDARFGDDSEGRTWAVNDGEWRGGVPLDTTELTNGWHCVAVRVDADGGAGRVHTGVVEAPILVANPGQRFANGTGGCFSS